MRKPKVFIGSSSESKGTVDELELALLELAEIHRWDRDTLQPGQFILDELVREANQVDFAIFVIGQDDVTASRDRSTPSPRDNVVFEAGLFCGILGRERVFYVVDNRGTKIPSDWGGVGYLPFDPTASPPRARVLRAVYTLKERFKELKPRTATSAQELLAGYWWQFVLNSHSGAVLSLLEIRPSETGSVVIEGTSWSTEGKKRSTYKSTSVAFDTKGCQLSYYWEGEHPHDPMLMPAFGIGKIEFKSDGQRAETGKGFFTTTNADLTATLKKSADYARATDTEIAIMTGRDMSARASLVRARLAERDEMQY